MPSYPVNCRTRNCPEPHTPANSIQEARGIVQYHKATYGRYHLVDYPRNSAMSRSIRSMVNGIKSIFVPSTHRG